jgi:hypothetical protein
MPPIAPKKTKPPFFQRRLQAICFAAALLTILAASNTYAEKPAPAEPDDQIAWHDCKDIGVEGKGWNDTQSFYDRLPAKAKDNVPPMVWSLSHQSAGLCVRFTTDAPSIKVRWTLLGRKLALPHMPATGVSGVDFYVKDKDGRWRFVGNGRPDSAANVSAFGVPFGKECLLYLPLYNGVKSLEIGVPKGQTLAACKSASSDPRKSVVVYGTSITQGACASRPGMAWTSIVGRRLDVPMINLGFSGSGRMEPEMADLLAELDPSVYVLDCVWNMSPQMVAERVEPFVKKLRAAHPKTPILLAEDSSFRNPFPTEKGRILRNVHQKLTSEGVKNLFFLSGQDMLGDDGEGTVDGCHPSDLGMMRHAEAFVKSLRPLVRMSPEPRS